MTDYIIIALLLIIALDTRVVAKLWSYPVELAKAIKHVIYKPFVKFKHWRHLRKIGLR